MHSMHLEGLELTQIRLLAELLRMRSVSAAAQSIGLSQSAASHALAKLRERLSDPLFIRTGNGFQPTPYGERVAVAARESLDVLEAGLSSNRPFEPATTTRRFTFFTSDIGQMVIVPNLFELLNKEAPDASVRVLPVPLDDPGAAMASGEVDCAVGIFDNLVSGFKRSLVLQEHYVCIVRTAHPKFRRGMNLEAFLESKHAVADSTGMAHTMIDRVLARHHISRRDAVRVPGFHVLPMIIANSELLAVVPSRLATAFSRIAAIKALPLPVSIPSFDLNVYWHERYHHDATNQWFRSILVRLLRQMNPRSRGVSASRTPLG
jgi:DNA-binding transcriptional LysR family regulator